MKVKMVKRLLAGMLVTAMSFSIVVVDGISVSAEEARVSATEEDGVPDSQTEYALTDEVTIGETPTYEIQEDRLSPDDAAPADEVPTILNGWIKKTEGWYYYKDGVMLTGWIQVAGVWYYMEETGLMAEDTWIGEYYVDANGAWITYYRPAQWIQT